MKRQIIQENPRSGQEKQDAKHWVLLQHSCEACGQVIPPTKDIPGPSTKN